MSRREADRGHRLRPGDTVNDVTLTDHCGADWRLSDHRGRVTLLIFHRHLM